MRAGAGWLVAFTFTITNTSVEQVTVTSLVDDKFGGITEKVTPKLPQTIQAGGSITVIYKAQMYCVSCGRGCLIPRWSSTYPSSMTTSCCRDKIPYPPPTCPQHVNTDIATAQDNEDNLATARVSATVKFFWYGFTSGYWKNYSSIWSSQTGCRYSPTTLVTSVFEVPGELMPYRCLSWILDLNRDAKNDTLLGTLNYKGGVTLAGKAQVLLRAAVAALLSEASLSNNYPAYNPDSDLINSVNTVLGG